MISCCCNYVRRGGGGFASTSFLFPSLSLSSLSLYRHIFSSPPIRIKNSIITKSAIPINLSIQRVACQRYFSSNVSSDNDDGDGTDNNVDVVDEQDTSKRRRVKKSGLYTRTGDSGTSMLFNGERRSKSDRVFKALGDQDELNASIGLAREYAQQSGNGLEEKLIEIQCRLFDLGAAVATPVQTSSVSKITRTQFDSQNTKILESWIDLLDAQLPPLKNFVIPSGGLCSVHLQMARTICRRAERSVVALVREGQVDEEVGRYLNRLSDFLFASARFAAKHDNKEEIIWRK